MTITQEQDIPIDSSTQYESADVGVHPTALVRLVPSIQSHWGIMGTISTRMQQFIHRFNLESDPATVCRHITSFWASGADNVAIWAAIDGERICGHAVAAMEVFWGKPYGMVLQVEVDHPYTLLIQQRLTMIEDMSHWALSQGGTCLKMLTPRNPDAWIRHSGFEFDKALLRLPLGGSNHA